MHERQHSQVIVKIRDSEKEFGQIEVQCLTQQGRKRSLKADSKVEHTIPKPAPLIVTDNKYNAEKHTIKKN